VEGVPTDSESLESAFHQHGINMRYLGFVASELKDKELNHLKILMEREVVFRSAKHLINEYIRESSDTYLSSVICHLLNLILSPFPLLQALNEGKITFEDNTI
jgi:protein TIF31